MTDGRCCEPSRTAAREIETLRNEFEVMKRCGFSFLEKIGARDADEYVIKLTSLDFLEESFGPTED